MDYQEILKVLADRIRQEADGVESAAAVLEAAYKKMTDAQQELGIGKEGLSPAVNLSGARGALRFMLFGDRDRTIPVMEKAFGRNFYPSWDGEFQSVEIPFEWEFGKKGGDSE